MNASTKRTLQSVPDPKRMLRMHEVLHASVTHHGVRCTYSAAGLDGGLDDHRGPACKSVYTIVSAISLAGSNLGALPTEYDLTCCGI